MVVDHSNNNIGLPIIIIIFLILHNFNLNKVEKNLKTYLKKKKECLNLGENWKHMKVPLDKIS